MAFLITAPSSLFSSPGLLITIAGGFLCSLISTFLSRFVYLAIPAKTLLAEKARAEPTPGSLMICGVDPNRKGHPRF